MPRTRRVNFRASNEMLKAITDDVEKIQEESAQIWAVLRVNNTRTQEAAETMTKLLEQQEESIQKLITIAGRA
ncbi:hypothetical protein [Paenibacillus tepidiphilus]|uniref:hypothetical protein n=1 Tax=Paenibacillus tepidiphilus TaxID=2608683 RepID=UPI001238C690|nr:hypothetical protein [Paenibacillus tepidiphilus]